MFRPCSTLLLLLGLAGPAAAQAPGTGGWTLAVGGYTILGQEASTQRVVLLPPVVDDTAQGDEHGFAAGLSAWPTGAYCDGPMSATMQQVAPRALLERIQLADRCGVRLVLVPPRRLLTVSEEVGGLFSVESANRLIDRYAEVLPPDTLAKYRGTILGLNLGDDYDCTRCWGGEPISQAQVAEWAAYTRAKLPGVPLGVRMTPDWVAEYPPLAAQLDYAWAQYHTGKGDERAFYDKAAAIAQRLGLRVVMGVNVKDCYGVGTSGCTAADLVRFGTLAVSHPASCAFINWRYDEAAWERAEIREAWDGLLRLARERGAEECRRAEGAG